MNIGLLLPTILMADRFSDRIFAPKDLFLALADGLKKQGHTVHVYTSGDPVLTARELSSVKIRTQESGQLLFRLNATEYEADVSARAFVDAFKSGVEVMHVYMDSIARYIAATSGIPTVTTLHDPLFGEDTLEGWRYRHFKEMPHVAISRRQRELYGPDFNVIDVVYHGVDVSTFPFGSQAGDYLAFVGRLIAEKGIEDALAVSAKSSLPIHIATSENYEETDYFTSVLAPKIKTVKATMTGFMHKPQRDNWMKGARALLFPIHWEEPFGMVMIEAMAAGTPVIAYNRGSVPEIIRDGVTGFVVDEKEGVDGLVKAVKRIGEIDRAACRRHVEEHFTVEKMVEGYEKVYQKILSQQPV